MMSVPLMLTFVSTVVFAIQLLIFVYLYSSHRVRFFQQRERVGMHRFEQDDHRASRNSGSNIASSKIAGSTC